MLSCDAVAFFILTRFVASDFSSRMTLMVVRCSYCVRTFRKSLMHNCPTLSTFCRVVIVYRVYSSALERGSSINYSSIVGLFILKIYKALFRDFYSEELPFLI